ncbi:unnamed protein product [Aphanomyces euteiches]|uniref:Uncharacterized protein n=1 Tax=Aphanomyces euteiches TaxID=100861 RepID=A0A6G0WNX8_9STRA|nr:hypothetical protein Ae201684_013214 [Aphanomyces euteiches]KAH9064858.1 hypothetical protein Ae201684P_003638 [Aphanomyces euteiches]KAH9133227.1 hypothetical protein AeRB84_020664 [Aphanomyces euteiches]
MAPKKTQVATPSTIYPESASLTPTCNPYLEYFTSFQKKQPKEMDRLFDPDLDDETRETLFNSVDDSIASKYSWAVPDERALRIIKHYGPIVEMGAGTGYWGRLLQLRGVDIKCFDLHVPGEEKEEDDEEEEEERRTWMTVEKGTPEVLKKHKKRTLMLCYPDDYEDSEESMSLECLNNYSGDTVIHIGELFGHTLCLPEPWGRTSSPEFQMRLAAVFHKVLQVPLPSWHSSMDTLTVWKRTKTCIVDDGIYAYIPRDERLHMVMASESTERLLHEDASDKNDDSAPPPSKKAKKSK